MNERERARHRIANMTPEQVQAKHRRDNRYRRHRRATDPELREREQLYAWCRARTYGNLVRSAERVARHCDELADLVRQRDQQFASVGWTPEQVSRQFGQPLPPPRSDIGEARRKGRELGRQLWAWRAYLHALERESGPCEQVEKLKLDGLTITIHPCTNPAHEGRHTGQAREEWAARAMAAAAAARIRRPKTGLAANTPDTKAAAGRPTGSLLVAPGP